MKNTLIDGFMSLVGKSTFLQDVTQKLNETENHLFLNLYAKLYLSNFSNKGQKRAFLVTFYPLV